MSVYKKGGAPLNVRKKGGAPSSILGLGETTSTVLTTTQREQLATDSQNASALTYLPGPNTAGLLPFWAVGDLTRELGALDGNGQAVITVNGLVENKLFFCTVRPGTFGCILRNCWLAGPKPGTYSTYGAMFRSFDAGIGLSTIEYSVVSGLPWTLPELSPPGGAWTDDETFRGNMTQSVGIRGGRVTVRFTEIAHVQDGVHVNMVWVDGDTLGDDYMLIEHCWIHDIIYYQGPLWPSQPEGTHSDSIQFHRGRNITIRFNFIKGGHNAGFMVKQEVSNATSNLIINVEIAYNIITQIAGNGYCINFYTGTVGGTQYNDWYANNMRIHDNLFYHPSNWDIIRNSSQDACFSNNLKVTVNEVSGTWVTGAAATKNNGG